jgi:hypothetical protein
LIKNPKRLYPNLVNLNDISNLGKNSDKTIAKLEKIRVEIKGNKLKKVGTAKNNFYSLYE